MDRLFALVAQVTTIPAPRSEPLVSNPVRSDATGYLYDLLRQWGLSDFASRTLEFLLLRPLRILVIVAAGVLASRWGARFLRRAVRSLRVRAPLRVLSARAEQRARTIADAVAGLWRVVVAMICVLMILGEVGVNLVPLLAGASIAGIAIGFGAQSLIKDYLSGIFILAEDQFGVGDVVTIGTATGSVEDLTLRLTRLRSADGTVWFVPNGDIRLLGNQSMEWSQAVVDVTIAYENDLPRVLAVLREEALVVAESESWKPLLLEPPEVLGVHAMATDGVTIRVTAKTSPRRQWEVARELRTAIADRLQREGIRGPGRQLVVTSAGLESPPPPAPADS
jgi:moderate conductance mechanosensitive channel